MIYSVHVDSKTPKLENRKLRTNNCAYSCMCTHVQYKSWKSFSVSISVPFRCHFFLFCFLSFPFSELKITSALLLKCLAVLATGRDGVH